MHVFDMKIDDVAERADLGQCCARLQLHGGAGQNTADLIVSSFNLSGATITDRNGNAELVGRTRPSWLLPIFTQDEKRRIRLAIVDWRGSLENSQQTFWSDSSKTKSGRRALIYGDR